ncbi:MAG: alpha/beta fold hydrolase [Flavobacteriales bacterium]|nr:alpha/beta fold hydrolase [Flavobacteriales bacterium]MCB9193772.1 alpha/beta fold hydrolase [Flavobacteriales bacterium]
MSDPHRSYRSLQKGIHITAVMMVVSSCNVVRMQERGATRQFRKAGLLEHVFRSDAGPRHVWSSAPTDKPDLMLVHGITSSAQMWSGNVRELARHFDLIVPDLIGHGGSTDVWSGNSVDAQVAHLDGILDSLHEQAPVFLVGNSYGGAMAANYAEQHPERVRVLVIYDGPANAYDKALADSAARAIGARDILDLFRPATPEERGRNINGVLAGPRHIPRFALRQINEAMHARTPVQVGLLEDLIAREDSYVDHQYQWTMPVYVIWGEQDRLIPPSVGKGILRINQLPKDHLIWVPDAGHVANIEHPDVFDAILERILTDGPCLDPARVNPGICTREYDPYCGCDDRTYPNRCEAWRAGIEIVSRGACP